MMISKSNITPYLFFVILLLFALNVVSAQQAYSTIVTAHSHNDYEQEQPFWQAYRQGFGSMEADVFLTSNDLKVAHDVKDIQPQTNLKNLYLQPLQQCLKLNGGYVYKDSSKTLLLLIDCKTSGVSTLQEIIYELRQYPNLIKSPALKFVITGNQPPKDSLSFFPSFIWFDGDLNYKYEKEDLQKIALFSANFRDYSNWDGIGNIDSVSKMKLNHEIKKAHDSGKSIRFWNAPDNKNAWKMLMQLGVDFINTDKIEALANYLGKQ